jgi:hypothetical protein
MKIVLTLMVFSVLTMAGTGLSTAQTMPKIIDTGKAPTVKDPTSLLAGITKDTKGLSGLVSKAISSGTLDKAKGNELLSSLKGVQGSADGLYNGVKNGKSLTSMSGDVKKLMGHASTVDKLVGGVPGLKDVTSSWNSLEKQINALGSMAGL